MTVVDSRLKKGRFILGPEDAPLVDISCQATAVSIEPDFDEEGDTVEVLCGDQLSPVATTSWALNFTGIQDFDDAEGIINFAYDHDGEVVEFSWTPNENSPTWSGDVNVRALTIGGDVAQRLDSEAEWPLNGKPERTMPDTEPDEPAEPDALATV